MTDFQTLAATQPHFVSGMIGLWVFILLLIGAAMFKAIFPSNAIGTMFTYTMFRDGPGAAFRGLFRLFVWGVVLPFFGLFLLLIIIGLFAP